MMKTIRNWTGLAALAACTLLPVAQAKEKTLYDRLGGKKAITAVVDEFVAASPPILASIVTLRPRPRTRSVWRRSR